MTAWLCSVCSVHVAQRCLQAPTYFTEGRYTQELGLWSEETLGTCPSVLGPHFEPPVSLSLLPEQSALGEEVNTGKR